MTERIVIEIDDSQLDSVLARLTTVSTVAKATTGSTNLADRLPTINREMRIILGQWPPMRQVIQGIVLARRELRGLSIGGVSFWMATVANVLILLREIGVMRRRLEREQREFERFVMQTRGFTKEELKRERVLLKYSLKGQP